MRGGTSFLRNFIAGRSGSMTVEFVVLSPLLLLALAFSFEFSRALWAYDVVTRDVRAGVRFVSRESAAPTPPNCSTASQNFMLTGDTSTNADASRHFPWKGVTPTFTCNIATFNSGFSAPVSVVTLRADVPINLSFLRVLDAFSHTSFCTTPSNCPLTLSVSDQTRFIGN